MLAVQLYWSLVTKHQGGSLDQQPFGHKLTTITFPSLNLVTKHACPIKDNMQDLNLNAKRICIYIGGVLYTDLSSYILYLYGNVI